MSSSVITTEITRVECEEEEENSKDDNILVNDSSEALFSSDSDSDEDLEDTRYEKTVDENQVCEEAIQKLKELFIRNNFNKLEIIQRKCNKNEANHQMVSHVVLIDKKIDPLFVEEFKDENNKYLFESKLKILKELELKLKQKIEKKKKSLIIDVKIDSIPKTFNEFLELILNELKADLIFDERSTLFFGKETHNRDIRFQSHDSYVNSFIPFVIREFWSHLKTNAKRELTSYEMSYYKSEPTNEIILSHIRNKSSAQSVFKFGQLVLIKYKITENQDSNESLVKFGVIIEVVSQLIDNKSEHLSHPLIKSQTLNEENDFIFEKLFIYCYPLAETFESVSVTPLTCVQKYFLEARIVYELEDKKYEEIFQQILKPRFKFGISGFSVNLEERKDLYDIQKDGIQKAYEVCFFPPMEELSSFVAIYGGPKTGKTEMLKETALQLLKVAEEKVKKLIIIAMEVNNIKEIIDTLKKNEIKVFHIDSEGKCLSHKNSEFKRLIKKMDRDHQFDDIRGKEYSLDECLKYFIGEIEFKDLLVRDQFVAENIFKKVVNHLIGHSDVIIGSIASVMNNEYFNRLYNMIEENKINCVLIEDAHLLTETEVLTLLYSGVRSFALFGDISKDPISYEKCESFLKRYVGLYLRNFQKTDTKYFSVLYLRETIESLQRLAENRNKQQNRFNNRQNNRKNANASIALYRTHSNYGSEYFNRSNRFKDYKPFKNENKDKDIPSNWGPKPEHRNQSQQSRPNPNTGQGSHNPMIDGFRPQLAFNNQNSYLLGNQRDSHHLGLPNPRNGMSTANNDPNANYHSNGTEFMSNPTRHQNYNLF